jgi:hypothetical protein
MGSSQSIDTKEPERRQLPKGKSPHELYMSALKDQINKCQEFRFIKIVNGKVLHWTIKGHEVRLETGLNTYTLLFSVDTPSREMIGITETEETFQKTEKRQQKQAIGRIEHVYFKTDDDGQKIGLLECAEPSVWLYTHVKRHLLGDWLSPVQLQQDSNIKADPKKENSAGWRVDPQTDTLAYYINNGQWKSSPKTRSSDKSDLKVTDHPSLSEPRVWTEFKKNATTVGASAMVGALFGAGLQRLMHKLFINKRFNNPMEESLVLLAQLLHTEEDKLQAGEKPDVSSIDVNSDAFNRVLQNLAVMDDLFKGENLNKTIQAELGQLKASADDVNSVNNDAINTAIVEDLEEKDRE